MTKFLDFRMCSGENLPKFLMSFLKAQVSFLPNFASIFSDIKHISSVLFSSNTLYFGQMQLIKVQIFEIFECSDENLPNSSYHFPNHMPVFLQIFNDSSVSWKITPLHFFRWEVMYFAREGPIKVQIFETFECSNQNLPNSCHFWNNKTVFLQICINLLYHET